VIPNTAIAECFRVTARTPHWRTAAIW